jgi:hypothetical protein
MTAQKSEHDTIDMAEYQKWWEGYKDKIKKSKNGGDVPDAYSDFINANLIHPKVKPEDLIKQENELDTNKKNMFADVLEGVKDTPGELKTDDISKIARNIDNLSPAKLSRYGKGDNPDDQKRSILQQAIDHRKEKFASPPNWVTIAGLGDREKKDAEKGQPEEIDPVSDADGKHWYTTDIPTKWSGQVDVPIDPDDPKKGTKKVSASGEGTELLQKPDGSLFHIVNVKYRNTPNGKEREGVKEVPVTSSYFAKINKDKKYKFNGLDENSIGGNNAPQGKSWADPSGNTHTLDDIKSGWKKKYGKDITDDQLTKVLSSLKAK